MRLPRTYEEIFRRALDERGRVVQEPLRQGIWPARTNHDFKTDFKTAQPGQEKSL